MTNEERCGLELLLQRLTWPSGLVRERACVSLGSLMADEDLGTEIVNAVLAWMAKQKLESVAVLGLLAFFQAKTRGLGIPTRDTVSRQIVKPSLLSWLVVTSVYKEQLPCPTLREMHSETAPAGFEADPFFLKQVETFVPPIYLERATRVDTKYSPGFLAQWKFEWTRLVELNGFSLHMPRLDFWTRQDDDHLLCLDLPLSETYRSAYLRAIAWATDEQLISPSLALWLSAQTCPIDLGVWQVRPGKAPDGWPKCEDARESIDTLPGKVTADLAAMWRRQVGEASGVTQNRPWRVTSKPANDKPLSQDVNSDVRAITLRRCEQRLERANETTNHRAGATGMVAAPHSESHGRSPGNGGRLFERSWGWRTVARLMGPWVGDPRQGAGRRPPVGNGSRCRTNTSKTGHSGDHRLWRGVGDIGGLL